MMGRELQRPLLVNLLKKRNILSVMKVQWTLIAQFYNNAILEDDRHLYPTIFHLWSTSSGYALGAAEGINSTEGP